MSDPKAVRSRRIVGIFAFTSFLHDMGSDMIFSVWPLFLTTVLGADMAIVGLIDGIGDAVVSISQAVSGYLSDRMRKRKAFVWMGYLFGAIAHVGYAIAPTWHAVLPFRILDRSGKMRGAPRDAIISDVSTVKNRGRHFGILRTMDNLGAVAGIFLSIVLMKFMGFRMLFAVAAIPSLLAVAVILFAVHEPASVKNIYRGVRFSDFSRSLRYYLLLSALFSVGAFSYSFLILFAVQAGIQTAGVPMLYLLFTVVAAMFSLPFGRLADAFGRKGVLLLSFGFWAGVSLLLMNWQTLPVLIGAFVLYGLHKAALEPVQRTIAAELASPTYLASSIGGYQMVIGLCSLPASLIAGLLWQRFGPTAPFVFSLCLTGVATILAFFLRETKGGKGEVLLPIQRTIEVG